MTVLGICKRVLAETGWPVPNMVAANSDATAQQVFTLCNTELQALSEMFTWPHLEVEYAINTVAGQAVYLWPTDFRVLAQSSLFNRNQYYELKGSTGLQFWELLKYGNLANLGCARYRNVYPLGVPGFEITPAPTGVQGLVAVYYTKEFARDANGVSIPVFMNDSDTPKVPERYIELGVKWRFRRAKGLDFSAELAEYNSTIQTQFAKYAGLGEIRIGGRRRMDGLTGGYVRENGFGA